jgi:FkbM family methyltransferase
LVYDANIKEIMLCVEKTTMKVALYRNLLKVRPAVAVVALKKIIRTHRIACVTKTGETFWVDPISHFGVELLTKGVYEPEVTALMTGLLRSGDHVIDVGANEGYFSVLASRFVGPGCVFCVEPQSRLNPVIKKNLELNRCKNVKFFQMGLSAGTERLLLNLSLNTNSGASSIHRYWRIGAGTEIVAAMTLDQFVKEQDLKKIRLLKVDCGGAEEQIVNGGQETLSSGKIDFLYVEFLHKVCGREVSAQIDTVLRDYGYRLVETRPGAWLYFQPKAATEEIENLPEIPPLAA